MLMLVLVSTLPEIEAAVLKLALAERVSFVNWLDQNRVELLPPEAGDAMELADAARREVLRRRDELIANPALAQDFDEDYFKRLRRMVVDVRTKKTSPG